MFALHGKKHVQKDYKKVCDLLFNVLSGSAHKIGKTMSYYGCVRRILKLVTTTVSKALKLRPRDTRQSSPGLFGDSKLRVTFRS